VWPTGKNASMTTVGRLLTQNLRQKKSNVEFGRPREKELKKNGKLSRERDFQAEKEYTPSSK